MKSSPNVSGSETPREWWWRLRYHCDYADFSEGIRIRYVGPKEHEGFRSMKKMAAWIYEVARRQPEVKAGQVGFPGRDDWRGNWPVFIDLALWQQLELIRMIDDHRGYRPACRTAIENNNPSQTGYSDPFPGFSFDLRADNAPLTQFFEMWIETQRAKYGIVRPKSKTKKDAPQVSHNKRDLPEKPDWETVEALDHVKGKGAPLGNSVRTRCSEARDLAERYLPFIVDALDRADRDPNLAALQKWLDL